MPRGISRHRGAEKQTILDLDSRTMAALSADVDDYDLSTGCSISIGGSGADRTIKGIAGGREGRVIELVNVLGYYIFLQNEATSSIAGNRILTGLSGGASYSIAPNAAVFLSYNNTVNRWIVVANSVGTYVPETDANIASLFRNTAPVRARGMLSAAAGSGLGLLKAKFTAKVSGDTGSQAFGAVTGAQVSFTLPAAGNVIVAVSGTAYVGIGQVLTAVQIGARFDSDTALILNNCSSQNGAGADMVGDCPLFGIWGKSLAAGAHTADLCWGDSIGNYGLRSNASEPAVIVVLYPG